MEFRTVMPPVSYPFRINWKTPILAMGSCFAANMGSRLQENKFKVVLNPFGVVFNPRSLADGLQRLSQGARFQREDLWFNGSRWLSFFHHGKFSGSSEAEVLDGINQAFEVGRAQLQEAKLLLLTVGTAYVWALKKTGDIVANCHKLPASEFDRRRMTVEEVVQHLTAALDAVFEINPGVEVLLTVSPVRYVREGLMESQRSKAVLLLATEAVQGYRNRVHYFPAYELLMDDLRDYRFYAEDMAHPSPLALEYIWNYFSDVLLEPSERDRLAGLAKIQRAMQHRPLFPDSLEHQRFRERLLQQVLDMEQKWPGQDFSKEKTFFTSHTDSL